MHKSQVKNRIKSIITPISAKPTDKNVNTALKENNK